MKFSKFVTGSVIGSVLGAITIFSIRNSIQKIWRHYNRQTSVKKATDELKRREPIMKEWMRIRELDSIRIHECLKKWGIILNTSDTK